MAGQVCAQGQDAPGDKTKLSEKSLMEAVQQTAAQQAAAAAGAPAPAAPDTGAAQQKLSEAEARIAALEKELSMAKAAAAAQANNAEQQRAQAAAQEADAKKLKERLEGALFNQAEELRGKVARTIPAGYLADTTIKRPRPAADGSGRYDSEMQFKVKDGQGRLASLIFPLQSGPDGRWQVPDVAVVQEKIVSFINSAAARSAASRPANPNATVQAQGEVHGNAYTPIPLPLPPGGQRAIPQSTPTQVVPDTYVIQWAGKPLNSSITDSTAVLQPVRMVPSAPLPVPAVQDRPAPAIPAVQAPRVSAPPAVVTQPAPAPAAPRPVAPSAPAPVMPVQESVQIRFE